MAGSHTSTSACEMSPDPSPLTLVSARVGGLPEQLAGRVDGHLVRFAEHMREGLLAASTAVGLEVMGELMDTEVTELAGPKGRHDPDRVAVRHGTEDGSVTLGGRRVPVRRPRVRSTDGTAEVAVPAYELFASTELLGQLALERMMAKLSTRRYAAGLEPVGSAVRQPPARRRARRSAGASWPGPRSRWPR